MKTRMPFYIFLLIFTVCGLKANAQKSDSVKVISEFKTQGEQEDYWVKQFFQKEYREQHFEIYHGKVVKYDGGFVFATDSLIVSDLNPEMSAIFLRGLLYPGLIGGNRISNIEEIKFIKKSPQQRRFRFLFYQKGLLNPTICFFELINSNATQGTVLTEFVNSARLTFFKQGWVMI